MRSLLIAISIIIGIFVLGVLFFYFNAAWVFSYALSAQFRTRCSVESVEFLSGEVRLHNITIGNPPPAKFPYALKNSYFQIKAPYGSYLRKEIQIDSIYLKDVEMIVEYYEKNGETVINWTVLADNLGSEGRRNFLTSRIGRSALIHRLVIENLMVRVIIPGRRDRTTTLPSLTFTDIKTEDGELTKLITEAIVYRMIFNVKNIVNIPFDAAKEGVDNVFKTIDDIFSPLFRSSREKEENSGEQQR